MANIQNALFAVVTLLQVFFAKLVSNQLLFENLPLFEVIFRCQRIIASLVYANWISIVVETINVAKRVQICGFIGKWYGYLLLCLLNDFIVGLVLF